MWNHISFYLLIWYFKLPLKGKHMAFTFFKSKIGEVPNVRSITCFLLYHTLGQITFFVYIIIWILLPPLLPIHSLRYMKWRNFKRSLKKNLKVHVMSVKKMKNVLEKKKWRMSFALWFIFLNCLSLYPN